MAPRSAQSRQGRTAVFELHRGELRCARRHRAPRARRAGMCARRATRRAIRGAGRGQRRWAATKPSSVTRADRRWCVGLRHRVEAAELRPRQKWRQLASGRCARSSSPRGPAGRFHRSRAPSRSQRRRSAQHAVPKMADGVARPAVARQASIGIRRPLRSPAAAECGRDAPKRRCASVSAGSIYSRRASTSMAEVPYVLDSDAARRQRHLVRFAELGVGDGERFVQRRHRLGFAAALGVHEGIAAHVATSDFRRGERAARASRNSAGKSGSDTASSPQVLAASTRRQRARNVSGGWPERTACTARGARQPSSPACTSPSSLRLAPISAPSSAATSGWAGQIDLDRFARPPAAGRLR